VTLSHLETPRLLLRPWRDADRAPFADLNADPRVMQFFPATLTREESDALADRAEAFLATHGYGPLAAELRDTGEFIGYIGLYVPTFDAHFTPCVEIGWRLAAAHWNRGLATEGAREILRHWTGPLVSFTSVANLPSRRVMEKLGFTHDPSDDFDHPRIPEGHPLRRHVLYRRAPLARTIEE
jgi:RimJ/RimL family protein N-acetyltransferase